MQGWKDGAHRETEDAVGGWLQLMRDDVAGTIQIGGHSDPVHHQAADRQKRRQRPEQERGYGGDRLAGHFDASYCHLHSSASIDLTSVTAHERTSQYACLKMRGVSGTFSGASDNEIRTTL